MVKLFRKVKHSIRRQFNKAFYKASENFNSEVEEIITKTLATEEIEEIVIRAVERVIFSLLRRYWFLIVILLIVLLGIQSIFLSIAITVLLRYHAGVLVVVESSSVSYYTLYNWYLSWLQVKLAIFL